MAAGLGLVFPAQSQSQGTQEAQFTSLLLSSAWCAYRYSATSGTESVARYIFHQDGTWSSGANREQLARNPQGQYYRRDGTQVAGCWAVQAGDLYMGNCNGPLSPVGASVRLNSNGYPIIVASAVEYMMCR
jgi:hypothetical protein